MNEAKLVSKLGFILTFVAELSHFDLVTESKDLLFEELRKILNWTCKNTVLQFNEKYYTQVDGVAMGSSIAPLMADVFMN